MTAELNKEVVTRVYGAGASRYDEVMARSWRALIDRGEVLRRLAPAPNGLYLEIGVGTGLNIPFYPPDATIIGVDLTIEMLMPIPRSSDGIGAPVAAMDGASLGFKAEVFDGIFATLVVSAAPAPRALLEEACRVCKSGGKLVIFDVCRSPIDSVARVQAELVRPYAISTGYPAPSTEFPGGVIVYEPTRNHGELVEEAGWIIRSEELVDPSNPFTCRVTIEADRPRIAES